MAHASSWTFKFLMQSAKHLMSNDTLTDQGDNSEIGPSSKNEDMPGFKTAEAAVRTILLNSQGVTVLGSFLPGNSLSMMLLRFANQAQITNLRVCDRFDLAVTGQGQTYWVLILACDGCMEGWPNSHDS